VRSRMSFLRIDRQKFREGIAGEAFCFDGGDGRRNVEDLCCLGQTDDVFLRRLAVNRRERQKPSEVAGRCENQLAVGGSENFELGHEIFPLWLFGTATAAGYKLGRACRTDTMSWNMAHKALSRSKTDASIHSLPRLLKET